MINVSHNIFKFYPTKNYHIINNGQIIVVLKIFFFELYSVQGNLHRKRLLFRIFQIAEMHNIHIFKNEYIYIIIYV